MSAESTAADLPTHLPPHNGRVLTSPHYAALPSHACCLWTMTEMEKVSEEH